MQWRYTLAHLILAIVMVLVLTLLMVCVDAQAQIAFSSNRDGNWGIYVMDNDGNNQRRLTNNPNFDVSPSWSPDGKRIVFMSNRDEHVIDGWPTFEIYVMDADGENQQRITENPNNDWDPSWSPDGKRIVFTSNREGLFNPEIYVMDVNGGNLQRLTNNADDDGDPSWSPDSKRIVFSAAREGHFANKFAITSEIYVMDADGGNQQRITENLFEDWHPSWSPDGKRIAFESDRKGDLQKFEIYVIDADGKNEQRLTENHVDDGAPSWSPDSKRIAFSSNRDGNFEIYVIGANGGNPQNLTNNPNHDVSPAWLNSPFSVSPAGKKFTMWGWLKQVDR